MIRQIADGKIVIPDLKRILVNNADEAITLVKRGLSYRKIAATIKNDQSTRSHTIVMIHVTQFQNDDNGKEKN